MFHTDSQGYQTFQLKTAGDLRPLLCDYTNRPIQKQAKANDAPPLTQSRELEYWSALITLYWMNLKQRYVENRSNISHLHLISYSHLRCILSYCILLCCISLYHITLYCITCTVYYCMLIPIQRVDDLRNLVSGKKYIGISTRLNES